jgi:hypothetical protein
MLDPKGKHDRRGLRQLDGCLHDLEDANERDERRVSHELATRVAVHVPDVVPGMPLRAAIDRVLAAQEQYLSGVEYAVPVAAGQRDATVSRALGDGAASASLNGTILDADRARELTHQIRMATRHMCLLLLEAHERRAWVALGYRTWEEYISRELGLSRTRSYEFLDQAHVIRAIMTAASLCGVPDISAYAAAQIKPCLPEVIEAIRLRLDGDPGDSAHQLIGEVIDQKRAELKGDRDGRRRTGVRPGRRFAPPSSALDAAGVEWLLDVIDHLANMPPVPETLARIVDHPSRKPVQVDRALAWLSELAGALSAGPPDSASQHPPNGAQSQRSLVGASSPDGSRESA